MEALHEVIKLHWLSQEKNQHKFKSLTNLFWHNFLHEKALHKNHYSKKLVTSFFFRGSQNHSNPRLIFLTRLLKPWRSSTSDRGAPTRRGGCANTDWSEALDLAYCFTRTLNIYRARVQANCCIKIARLTAHYLY